MIRRSYTQTAMPPSARSAATGRSRRVLLVHANPFQRVTPVPAYGLERLRLRTNSVIHDIGALIVAGLTLIAIVFGLGAGRALHVQVTSEKV